MSAYFTLEIYWGSMGSIDFEGWNVEVDDFEKLNKSPEIMRLGLNFESESNCIWASVSGNITDYHVILREVKQRLISGGFNVNVELGNGEKITIILSSSFVMENHEDITEFIGH